MTVNKEDKFMSDVLRPNAALKALTLDLRLNLAVQSARGQFRTAPAGLKMTSGIGTMNMDVARRIGLTTVALLVSLSATEPPADPVIPTHPRLLFSASGKGRLLMKKNTNDPSWLALKA